MLESKKLSRNDFYIMIFAGFIGFLLLTITFSEPVEEDLKQYFVDNYELKETEKFSKIDAENNSNLDLQNVYLYNSSFSPHLNNDALILKPNKSKESSLEAVLNLRDNKDISIKIKAINAALLTKPAAKWLSTDCGQSKISLEVRNYKNKDREIYESITKKFVANNKFIEKELNLDRFSGEQVRLVIDLKEFSDCSLNSNQAVYIRELYLASS